MNQQQFDDEQPSPLRSQRMTEEEAKAVIDLWQQEEIERGGLTTSPAVPDVAEGLNVSVEDVQRLLQQVRAQRQAEERRFALEQYEVELEQIRLAEEERKLTELQRQRAELRRDRAESRRRQNHSQLHSEVDDSLLSQQRNERIGTSNSASLGVVVFLVIAFIFLMIVIGAEQSAHTAHMPETTCAIDGKQVPCSEFPIDVQNRR